MPALCDLPSQPQQHRPFTAQTRSGRLAALLSIIHANARGQGKAD